MLPQLVIPDLLNIVILYIYVYCTWCVYHYWCSCRTQHQRVFKLKNRLRLSEVWVSETVHEALPQHDSAFTIGWPITNYIALFRWGRERDRETERDREREYIVWWRYGDSSCYYNDDVCLLYLISNPQLKELWYTSLLKWVLDYWLWVNSCPPSLPLFLFSTFPSFTLSLTHHYVLLFIIISPFCSLSLSLSC